MRPTLRGNLVNSSLTVASLALLTAVALPATPGSAQVRDAARTLHIAYFGYAAANNKTQEELGSIRAVAKTYGASLTFFNPNGDPTAQVQQIKDATVSGQYNLFIVYSVSGTAAVQAVKQAISQGIKVVADFTPIGPNQDSDAIQVPGEAGSVVVPIGVTGTYAGDLIVQACAAVYPCRVVYMPGDNTLPLEIDRTHHAVAALKNHSNIHLLGVVQGGYTPALGYTASETVLTQYPNVNVIAASSDESILGTARFIQARGLESKHIKLIGAGGTTQAVAGIKNGSWFGTVVYCGLKEGTRAAQVGIDAVLGHPAAVNVVNSNTICGVPPTLTKQNVGNYPGLGTAA